MWSILKRSCQFSQSSQTIRSHHSAARSSNARRGEGREMHTPSRATRSCQDRSTHSLHLRELLQELQSAQPLARDAQEKRQCSGTGALAQRRGGGSPAPGCSHNKPAPEVLNVLKLQPADINNLQFMMCSCCNFLGTCSMKHKTGPPPRRGTGRP